MHRIEPRGLAPVGNLAPGTDSLEHLERLVGRPAAARVVGPERLEFSLSQPTPAPSVTLPPENLSMVTSMRAVSSGLRYGMIRTAVPSRTRRVAPASTPRVASGSYSASETGVGNPPSGL